MQSGLGTNLSCFKSIDSILISSHQLIEFELSKALIKLLTSRKIKSENLFLNMGLRVFSLSEASNKYHAVKNILLAFNLFFFCLIFCSLFCALTSFSVTVHENTVNLISLN